MVLVKQLAHLGALFSIAAIASPTPLRDLTLAGSPETNLLVREGIRLSQSRDLEKRIEADFSLDRSWDNVVLFGGAWSENDTQTETSGSGSDLVSVTTSASASAHLSVTCLECRTSGTVTAKLDDSDFFKPSLRLEFIGVEAYAFLGVEVSGTETFSVTLFASDSPLGLGVPGLDVGVVFFVDLVFSLSEAIDLTAGFDVTVPDGSYLEASIFGGDIGDTLFEGLESHSLPVTVYSGAATFKADLRLRVQAGAQTELEFLGIGAGAVVGVYANIIEFVAVIESTPACSLETELWWDMNVGAYANLDVVVDYTTLGPVPTISTTLMAASTISTCLIEATATTSVMGVSVASATVTPTLTAASTFSASSYSGATQTGSTFSASSYSGATETASSFTVSSYDVSTFSVISYDSTASAKSTFSVYSYSSSPTETITIVGGKVPASTTSSTTAPQITSAPVSSLTGQSLSTTNPAQDSSAVTYTSTYTYTVTRCKAQGVINCPASYQSTVVATETSTICPYQTTTPSAASQTTTTVTKVILTTLPTPVTSTFASPAPTTTTTTVSSAVVQVQEAKPTIVTETATVSPVIAIAAAATTPANSASPSPSPYSAHTQSSNITSTIYAVVYPTPKVSPGRNSTVPTQTPIPMGDAGRPGASGSALMTLGMFFIVFWGL
ncbi:hypothetical protein F5Y16DRAFT_376286 [Xylariaceae sp. FL0255]|nr:hypothetical protein F5Y16DRAFT_376286 [Xylariaceae sp. FL0255]